MIFFLYCKSLSPAFVIPDWIQVMMFLNKLSWVSLLKSLQGILFVPMKRSQQLFFKFKLFLSYIPISIYLLCSTYKKKKKKKEGRTKNSPHPNTHTKQSNSKNKTFLEVKCEVLFSLVRLELKLYYSFVEECVYFLYNCSWKTKLQ